MKLSNFIAKLFLLSLFFLSANAFGQDLTISPQNRAEVDWTSNLFPNTLLYPTPIASSPRVTNAGRQHIIEAFKDGSNRFIRTTHLSGAEGYILSLGITPPNVFLDPIPGDNYPDQIIGCYEDDQLIWLSRLGGTNLRVNVESVATTIDGKTVCVVDLYSQNDIDGIVATRDMSLCVNKKRIVGSPTMINCMSVVQTTGIEIPAGTDTYFRATAILVYDNTGVMTHRKTFPVGAQINNVTTDELGNIYFSGHQKWTASVQQANYDGNIIRPLSTANIANKGIDGDIIIGKLNAGTLQVEWIESINNKTTYRLTDGFEMSLNDIAHNSNSFYVFVSYPILDIQPNPKIYFSSINSNTVHNSLNAFPNENKVGYALMKFNSSNGSLDWISDAYTGIGLKYSHVTSSYMSISNDQIYIGTTFGNSMSQQNNSAMPSAVVFNPSSLTNLGSTFSLNSNKLPNHQSLAILAYKLDGTLSWAKSTSNETRSQFNTLTSDEDGNIYLGFSYRGSGNLGNIGFTNSNQSNPNLVTESIAKLDKCGNPFWIKSIGERDISNDDPDFIEIGLVPLSSDISYISSDKIYIGNTIDNAFFTSSSQELNSSQILRLKNTPETSCAGLLLTGNPTGTNWQWFKDDCATPIVGANLPTYTAMTEGNYHATAIVNGTLQSSNAVWVNMTPEFADFEILGETRVCLNTYQYSISNIQSDVTYEWKLDGQSLYIGSTPFSKQWLSSDAGFHTISVTAETQGHCIFTKELKVEVFNPAPPLNISSDQTICATSNLNYFLISALTDGYTSYRWSPATALTSTWSSQPYVLTNDLPIGTTTYTVTATMPNGCSNTETVSITKTSGATLTLPPSICRNQTLALTGGVPAGGTYTGQGVSGSIATGFIFDPSGLQAGFSYPITYTTTQGCVGTATAEIEVRNSRKDYNLQIRACANSSQAEVFLSPTLSDGDELVLPGQTYTSGGYWIIPASVGNSFTATINNNNPTVSCGGTYLNNSLGSVTVTVLESPAKDLYYKDHPSDFGQQPSGGGWNSPSISVTRTAPPVGYDASVPLYPNLGFNINTQPQKFIKFYYNDGNTSNFATVEAVADAHPGTLVGGTLNYIYLRVYNKCGTFGEGLQFDISFSQSVTTLNPGGWTSYLPAGLIARIPRNLPSGGELIIVIPVDAGIIGIGGGGHTCSYAQLFDCPNDLSCQETPGFGHLPSVGISGSNNKTWRNLNFISSIQGQGTVTIKNDDLVGKMVRVKYDFDPHTPSKAHYLEYNNLQISLPQGLLSRWSANNYLSNNVDFINGSSSLVGLTEQRNGWMEFWLDAGESYTLGLSFNIPPSNNLSLQDPSYRFHVKQFNEGVQAGGVSYDLMIDFVDTPPVTPSNLQAQALSSSSIKLTWQDNSNNEQVFVLERRRGNSAYEIIANINSNVTTYTDTGLDYYTTYQYRLKAMSATGLSSTYIYSSARTFDIAPATPTNLRLLLTQEANITLEWNHIATNTQYYQVERKIGNGSFSIIHPNLSANNRIFTDTNVMTAGNYTYRVTAFSTLPSGYVENSIPVVVPATPVWSSPISIVNGNIVLAWNPVQNATGYRLERSENGGSFVSVPNFVSSTSNTTYTDNNVSAGSSYLYKLYALRGNYLSSLPATADKTIPNVYQISGTIKNHSNQAPVGNVKVQLIGNGNVVEITTGSDGKYSFDDVTPNTTYTIRPSKNSNPRNGFTGADLSALGNIAGNPYLYIAADVNNDCIVDNADYDAAFRFIYRNGSLIAPSWKFVSSDYNINLVYTATVNQSPCFDNSRTYTSVNSSYTNQDFVGIKTGDMNGDVNSLWKVAAQIKVEKVELTASPNPFNSSTIIRFSSEISDEKYTMLVRNSLGQEIKRIEGVAKKGNNEVEINMLGYSSGMYYVEYISSDRRENIKIVLAR